MTSPNDHDLWRSRFITINFVRIGGTAVALLGCAICYTNLVVPDGSLLIGLPIALVGVAVSFAGPVWLSRHWKRQDGR